MSASVVDQPTRDAQRAVGVDAHRLEHRRRLQVLRRAGAARVGGDAGLVEAEQHGLRLDAVDAEAHDVGQPVRRRVAVGVHAVERRRAAPATRSVSRRSRGRLARDGRQRLGRGRAQARRWRARSRCRPAGPAPGRRRRSSGRSRSPRRTSSAPTPCGPPSLWALTDMQVGAELVEVDRHVAGGLGGVDVDQHAPLPAGGHDLGDRLQRADLVVAPLQVHRAPCPGATAADDVAPGRPGRAGRRRRRDRGARADGVTHRRVLDRRARRRGRRARSTAPQHGGGDRLGARRW